MNKSHVRAMNKAMNKSHVRAMNKAMNKSHVRAMNKAMNKATITVIVISNDSKPRDTNNNCIT
jgi:RecA/RadA recombinase